MIKWRIKIEIYFYLDFSKDKRTKIQSMVVAIKDFRKHEQSSGYVIVPADSCKLPILRSGLMRFVIVKQDKQKKLPFPFHPLRPSNSNLLLILDSFAPGRRETQLQYVLGCNKSLAELPFLPEPDR